eukprot:scaffold71339_cov36-Phaeocystis_antarctica.AAC.1
MTGAAVRGQASLPPSNIRRGLTHKCHPCALRRSHHANPATPLSQATARLGPGRARAAREETATDWRAVRENKIGGGHGPHVEEWGEKRMIHVA